VNIGGFELIYRPGQALVLGKRFATFDVSDKNRTELRELTAFHSFAKSDLWSEYDSCGLFSPKFLQKSNITSDEYVEFIEANRGVDVYLFHPFPRENLIANHFLELAELEHPGISAALSRVWQYIFGRDLPEIDMQRNREYACHCNYFSGNQRFWKEYSGFICRFFDLLESEEGAFLRAHTPYTLTQTSDRDLPMAVFVFERSLTHFLFDNRKKFRVVNLATDCHSWHPCEVFRGEANFITDVLDTIASVPPSRRWEARRFAVNSYYFRRKLGVLVNE